MAGQDQPPERSAATPRTPIPSGAPRRLGYDEVVRELRVALIACTANAQAFAARRHLARDRISARTWSELAQIEARLAKRLHSALQSELRAQPWTFAARVRATVRSLRDEWSRERPLLVRRLREAQALPVAAWRAGNPQLEARVWPFLQNRTEHLANALALALNEPAPFPPIVWHAGRQEFLR
jgi:hypothetical protein